MLLQSPRKIVYWHLRNEATSKCCCCMTQRALVCERWVVIKNLIGSRYHFFFSMWQNFFFIANYSSSDTDLKFPNGFGALLTMCAMFYEYYFLRGMRNASHSIRFAHRVLYSIYKQNACYSVSSIDNSRIFSPNLSRKKTLYIKISIKRNTIFIDLVKLKIEREKARESIYIHMHHWNVNKSKSFSVSPFNNYCKIKLSLSVIERDPTAVAPSQKNDGGSFFFISRRRDNLVFLLENSLWENKSTVASGISRRES